MTRPGDTAQMSSEARLTEVAGILAVGYVRLRLTKNSLKELDLHPRDGAHMDPVNRQRTPQERKGAC